MVVDVVLLASIGAVWRSKIQETLNAKGMKPFSFLCYFCLARFNSPLIRTHLIQTFIIYFPKSSAVAAHFVTNTSSHVSVLRKLYMAGSDVGYPFNCYCTPIHTQNARQTQNYKI